jgi:hypothetical protein
MMKPNIIIFTQLIGNDNNPEQAVAAVEVGRRRRRLNDR